MQPSIVTHTTTSDQVTNDPVLLVKPNQTTKGVDESIIDTGTLLAVRAPSSTARQDNDKVRKIMSM